MKKKFLIVLASGLFMFGFIGMVNATVLTFEDTDYSNAGGSTYAAFQGTYGGFGWTSQFGVFYGPGMNSGYDAGTVSGDYALFNMFGDGVTIIKDEVFDWNGAWFSSVRTDGGNIAVEGYSNGTRQYTGNITLTWENPAWFQADWAGIDEIRLLGCYNVDSTRFAMDDFTFNELAPVPEPATMFLFGLGLLGLSGISRRRKQ